jgi:hypothetical protein
MRGVGEPEGVEALGTDRRGGFPPVLALTHSSFHMLTVKTVAASWAHFSISIHSLNWGHK